jgi:hypothetical protein
MSVRPPPRRGEPFAPPTSSPNQTLAASSFFFCLFVCLLFVFVDLNPHQLRGATRMHGLFVMFSSSLRNVFHLPKRTCNFNLALPFSNKQTKNFPMLWAGEDDEMDSILTSANETLLVFLAPK